MAFYKDYTSTKKIIIAQSEHKVTDFPIVQVYVKENNSFNLAGSSVNIDSSNKITIEFSSAITVRVVVK
ncbi:hypothetical protein [Myroides odoratimimus]|uniref:hypothetical protein n=1 Tax=Myroides odoratimimus TaxID=76832 RepID=UPI002578EA16|nr:hypothetical protein [Myroides odoratimimus]MDM1513607.1 hypothetical protein [Myroides odoratimimus]